MNYYFNALAFSQSEQVCSSDYTLSRVYTLSYFIPMFEDAIYLQTQYKRLP